MTSNGNQNGNGNGIGTVSNLGYPRIGEQREWKKALEAYWKGELPEERLEAEMKRLRLQNIKKQHDAGVDLISAGDFTRYDHVLDHTVAFGLVPERFGGLKADGAPALYFAMARGAEGIAACEMTKWFNTNYHYIVPEWGPESAPALRSNPWLAAFEEAKAELGLVTKPVLVGPYTFVRLSKGVAAGAFAQAVRKLLPVYAEVLAQLEAAGAEWVQIDEPALALDVAANDWPLLNEVYHVLRAAAPGLKLIVQTYFDAVDDYEALVSLPVNGIGLDFVHDGGATLKQIARYGFPPQMTLGAGIVDGRNIWRTDLTAALALLDSLKQCIAPERIMLQPSCSLLHAPVTLKHEKKLQGIKRLAMAFADEKLGELAVLRAAMREGLSAVKLELQDNTLLFDALRKSPERNRFSPVNGAVDGGAAVARRPAFEERRKAQQAKWNLPLLPTTTIGSLPQTSEIRKARRQWRKGELDNAAYETFIRAKIAEWIAVQEQLGLDVLVHGEFERNDMVEFFGECLEGYVFTDNGWVQSYGSRCVKPPVLFGDIAHTAPMTVPETVYAASLTDKPVKGMLTGPLTMLNWSFVRTDIPRKAVAFQLADAIRAEVEALEAAGIGMIQVDEPALREGAPLKNREWQEYLGWGVEAFKRAVGTVQDTTQIHTHMCYCDFHEMIGAIRDMDADVISLETSRSHGTLIEALRGERYDKGIGLGVYDIHSPFIPDTAEMERIIREALDAVPPERLWVNPDCGLKTRNTEETLLSLRRMVEAADRIRGSLMQVGV